MRQLTLIAFLGIFIGHAQVDYKSLVKKLEDVTIDTDVKQYFKDLHIEENFDGKIKCNDERFLRFYNIVVNKVTFEKLENEKEMHITFFNENREHNKLKSKLIKNYGKPKIENNSNALVYKWENNLKVIKLDISNPEKNDESLAKMTINFIKQ